MSKFVNKVILLGRVGRKPELRFLANGSQLSSFSLATTESWKDKQTQEWREQTEWHRLVAYRKLAEYVSNYINVGDLLYVEGKLKYLKWTDENTGQEKNLTEVQIYEAKIIYSKKPLEDCSISSNNLNNKNPTIIDDEEIKNNLDIFELHDEIPF